MRIATMLLAAGVLLSLSLTTQADQLALVNGGFEAGEPVGWSRADFTGWTNSTEAAAIALDSSGSYTEGAYGLLVSLDDNHTTAQFMQTTNHVIQEGYTYTLSADARSYDGGARQFLLSILAVDGVNPAEAVAGQGWNATTGLVYGTDDVWRTYSVSFTATAEAAGKTLTIYHATQGDNTNKYGYVDNVVLESVVPEPATMALLSLGGLAVSFTRKRRNVVK